MTILRDIPRTKPAGESHFPIDIVVPWVDDRDPLWRTERDLHLLQDGSSKKIRNFDVGEDRFRSWDNLQYIFRGIENYMPWVRKIHLVTNGQMPSWLSLAHPKLNFVKHSDYIPDNFLPTFNSHVIELNLHRIPDLAEHFIYFNDDTFVIRPMKPSDFFSDQGLPRDQFGLWRVKTTKYSSVLPHVSLNNMAVLNQNFNQRKVLKKQRVKLLNTRNGMIQITLTLVMSTVSRKHFSSILFHHMPAAFMKQSFRDVWAAEPEILNKTSNNKFRNKDDVSQYVVRAWQMVSGNFEPRNISAHSEHFTYLTNDYSILTNAIRKRKLNGRNLELFCVSDEKIKDFPRAKQEINEALQEILPHRSSFEIREFRSASDHLTPRDKPESISRNSVILQSY